MGVSTRLQLCGRVSWILYLCMLSAACGSHEPSMAAAGSEEPGGRAKDPASAPVATAPSPQEVDRAIRTTNLFDTPGDLELTRLADLHYWRGLPIEIVSVK